MKIARAILLWTFVACVNLPLVAVIVYASLSIDMPEFVVDLSVALFSAALVLSLVCIVFAIATHGKSLRQPDLQKGLGIPVAIAKGLLVPFFIVVFLFVLLYMFATAIATLSIHLASAGMILGMSALILFPILAVICYLIIMATSAFSVSAIIIEYRKGTIKLSTSVILSILQFVPVADVISYPFIVAYFRRCAKARMQQAQQQPGLYQPQAVYATPPIPPAAPSQGAPYQGR